MYDSTAEFGVSAIPLGCTLARPACAGPMAHMCPRRRFAAGAHVTEAGQGCAVSAKLCAAEPSQARWVSCTLFAAEPAEVRHLPLCRAVK